MKLVQITPGAGGMYCGNCFRDNALVSALRKAGHEALMVPLYLPMALEEEDHSAGTPLFFNGINVYLEHKLAWYRRAPNWLRKVLGAPWLIRLVAGRAASTRPSDVGDLTVSMLQGEAGHQARELEDLVNWLAGQGRPEIICLSNALLLGLARELKRHAGCPVVCMLQGEDTFVDGLPEPHRTRAWSIMSERAFEVDGLVAPSRYFAELMTQRLGLPSGRVRVVFNGINLDGYDTAPGGGFEPGTPERPVLGYFARMCREKGLDLLADAFVILRKRDRIKNLRLRVGGGCVSADRAFVELVQTRLRAEGLLDQAEFHPNLDRKSKQAFLKSLSVFSVPAVYGEAFGLYLIEALASGVPVVQPREASFPELVAATGGGLLCEPRNAVSLAEAIETLLGDPAKARALGQLGREQVRRQFSVEMMRDNMLAVFRNLLDEPARPLQAPGARL